MKSPQLLFVCWCSSVVAVTSCFTADGCSCVSTYWDKVTCVLNITDNPMGRSNNTLSLRFTDNRRGNVFTCPLAVKDHGYGCDCKVTHYEEVSSLDNYSIELCNETSCVSLTRHFMPSQNIQLTPPQAVQVQHTPEGVNVTWDSGYEKHEYFYTDLDYELLHQNLNSSVTAILNLRDLKFRFFPRSQSAASYCAKVRSKPSPRDYEAIWSEWSPQICWEDHPPEASSGTEHILVTATKSLVLLCAIAGVLLFVFYSPAARMKLRAISHAPSPVSFFQPLFQQHEGNLKEWLSPEGKVALGGKADEILITDVVTVVPKPNTADPEEYQDSHHPPTTPMLFSQCQSSYVGLPGMHDPHPVTDISPKDTPDTQLPCPLWAFSIKEVPAVFSPLLEVSDTSLDDSGCSCKDLSQSPECSLPSSPVEDSLPPCYCSDYCILNKTAQGVVPVLVSQ